MHRLWNESFMAVHFVSRVYLALRLKTTTNHNNCLSITNTIICLALTRSNNWKRSFYSCRSVCVLHIWPADERVNMLLYTDLACHLLEYNYIKTDKNHQYSFFFFFLNHFDHFEWNQGKSVHESNLTCSLFSLLFLEYKCVIL